MIRPETIGIVAEADAFLRGTVESVAFIGDRQRLVVAGAANKLLTVDAPNTINVKAGERVGLSVAPEAVRLLPKED
jgi:putative spermidine/putrescine transport system ATP-binding protein